MDMFLRSRRGGWTVLLLTVAGAIGWWWFQQIDDTGPELNWALIGVPLMMSVVIGVSTHSPFGDVEATASRTLSVLRFGHLALLLGSAAFALLAAVYGFSVTSIEAELIRNLAGLAGLALIAAWLVGSDISWVAPLAYSLVALLVDPASRWGWLTRYPYDDWSLTVAATLLAAGLLVAVLQPGHSDVESRITM